MKKIIIALVVIVILVLIWQAIQTKPDTTVPVAKVIDATPSNVDPSPVTSTTTNNTTVFNTTTEIKTSIAGTDKEVDNSKVAIAFTGFGPGKKHLGSFSDIRSNLKVDASNGLSGNITVGMASLTSDSDKLVTDLKSANFFDVAKYPTATFKLTKLEGGDAQGGTATGIFTIRNINKTVTFPFRVNKSADAEKVTGYSATFNINMKEFGIDQKFANEVVELNVVVPFK